MPVWLTWTAISALFNSVRFWAIAAAVSGAVITLGYLVLEYDARGTRIEALTAQVTSLKNSNQVCLTNYKNSLETVDELNLRLKDRSGTLDSLCKAYVKTKFNVDPESNECIDPVVGGALEDLKELEKKETP